MPINLQDSLPQPPAAAAPADDEGGGIPDEVLQIPAFAGLLRGTPPAVWAENGVKSPEGDIIVKNQKPLAEAGFGFYNSPDKKTNVVFNSQFTSLPEIEAMDKAGKLRDFATPIDDLRAAFAGSEAPPEGAAAPPAPGGPAQVAPVPPNASLDKKLATARISNAQPGSPTSGPVPGQGRILNSIMKPTV
jgi:hypothetical protein